MDIRGVLKNVSIAFAAQGVSMLASLVVSLLVPKVLGVVEFGYWQLFLFYSGYVGFFHFGLNDGVYLVNGGLTRDEVNRRSINSQFVVGILYQSVIALGIVAYALVSGDDGQRVFVLVAVAIYLLLSNAAGYLGFTFQALNETKFFSFSSMIDRLSFLAPLVFLILFQCADFRVYVVLYIVARAVCLGYCFIRARSILSSGFLAPSAAIRETLLSIRIGVKLMLANVASMLILGVMRFAVDAKWGIAAFGEVSFSLTMVNFFLTFISQVAMVLFPALRRASDHEQISFFKGLDNALTLLLPAVYGFCFPIALLLSAWLPQYAGTMQYFAFLLPICVFDSKMNLLGTTYFKVFRMEKTLLAVNIATVAISGVGVAIGVTLFESITVTLIAVVIAIAVRSLVSEAIVARALGGSLSIIALAEVVLTLIFVALPLILEDAMACGIYWMLYGLYLALFRRELKETICKFAVHLGRRA